MANGKTKAKKQVLLATALALPPHFEISNAAHRPQTGGLFPPKRQSPYTESSLLPWPTKAHFGAGVLSSSSDHAEIGCSEKHAGERAAALEVPHALDLAVVLSLLLLEFHTHPVTLPDPAPINS